MCLDTIFDGEHLCPHYVLVTLIDIFFLNKNTYRYCASLPKRSLCSGLIMCCFSSLVRATIPALYFYGKSPVRVMPHADSKELGKVEEKI
jgi:hypothetical protein